MFFKLYTFASHEQFSADVYTDDELEPNTHPIIANSVFLINAKLKIQGDQISGYFSVQN